MERIRLKWFQGAVHGQAYEWVQLSQMAQPEGWRPAINAYRCECCIKVCVDLAGVLKPEIEIRVEPRRILLRGVRPAPEPAHNEPQMRQILAMEIDYGPFVRELHLPAEVDPAKATAEQRNGLLWIDLPLRS